MTSYDLQGGDFKLHRSPRFELFVDLSSNLRVKNKSENFYGDAVSLAGGDIESFRRLRLDDGYVCKRINHHQVHGDYDAPAYVTFRLKKDHTFQVDLEWEGAGCLRLDRKELDP